MILIKFRTNFSYFSSENVEKFVILRKRSEVSFNVRVLDKILKNGEILKFF